MVNLAVINIKDILKLLKKIIVFAVMLLIILKLIFYIKNNIVFTGINFESNNVLDKTILISNCFNGKIKKSESGVKKVLVSQLAIFSTEEELMEAENQEEVVEFEDNSNEVVEEIVIEENVETIDMTQVPNNSGTTVIEKNNKKDVYTDIYQSVKIKNESSYALTEEMVTPNIDFENKKDIIIFHTHTCESYTPTEKDNYVASGNFRTTDLNYSVAKVGSTLTTALTNIGFNVIHDRTYHDYPAYSGSYSRSLATVKNILTQNPNAQLVIDLHRDALGSSSSYAPSVKIGEEVAAQLMFVMGTDGGGLEHKNWLKNFKLAIKIQEKANEMYPGLFKPIILRNSRYNQHVTTGACIIEVGATGNTLEQCNTSMKYLAKVIEEVMK